jgi:thioredoxin reductase (NADPH)
MLDLAIIGGGPAGLTAGLYATRGGLKSVTMFEKGVPGGQIMNSSEIENYPGVPEVMSGMDLMAKWPEQCQRFGLKHEMITVTQITRNSETGIFTIHKEDGTTEDAISVIVGTGSTPKRAGFKGENEFFGKGVSTCATCDGFFYKDKEVTVIGGGDTALEEAVYLAGICSKVYLVHRRDTFRAAPSTVERAKNTPNIEFIVNSTPDEVFGEDFAGVQGIKIKTPEGVRQLDTTGVFIFVGNDVNNGVLKQDDDSFLCDITEWGEVVVNLKMETSIHGLYATGDMRLDAPKQVVVAAGDGSTAAIGAISYVMENK